MSDLQNNFNSWKRKILISLCVVFSAFIGYQGLVSLINTGMPSIKNFSNSKGSYQLLKQRIPLADIAIRAKEVIPANACLRTSLNENDPIIAVVTLKYYLFPLKVLDARPNDFNKNLKTCTGQYFLDLNHSRVDVPIDSKVLNLSRGARVFAMDHSSWNAEVPKQISGVQVLFKFCHFTGVVLLIGSFIFCGLYSHGELASKWANFSSAFLIGFVVVTVFFWLLAVTGKILTPTLVWLSLYGMSVASYFFMRIRKSSLARIVVASPTKPQDITLVLLVIMLSAFVVLYTVSFPICVTDELNIWLLKAKMFFDHQGLVFDYTEYDNNYYPVLWPLNIALQYVFIGGIYDEVAKWTAAIIFICLIGQMKWLGHLLGFNRRISSLAVLVFLLLFHHWTFFTALAENVYIALMALALASFVDWMINKRAAAIAITTLALVGASATKFEGVFVTVFLFVAYLASQRITINNFLSRLKKVSILCLPLLMHGFWLIWLNIQHISYAVYHLQRNLSFENITTLFLMVSMFLRKEQLLLIVLVGVTIYILSSNRRVWSQEERFLLIFSGGLMLFGLSAGMCWPPNDFRLYYPEVLERLFSRVMPFLTLLWVSRVMMTKKCSRATDS